MLRGEVAEIRPPPGVLGSTTERRKNVEQIRPIRIIASRKNDTIYIVEHAASDTAKEFAFAKVKRLILNNTESSQKTRTK